MNKLPRFGGDDGSWVYDRILVVKCDNVIPAEKQDKQLLDKMYAERDGIIFKLVQALKTVIPRSASVSILKTGICINQNQVVISR